MRRARLGWGGLLALGIFTVTFSARAEPPPSSGEPLPPPPPGAEPAPPPAAAPPASAVPAGLPPPGAAPPSPSSPGAAPLKSPGVPLGPGFPPNWSLPPELPYREGEIVPRGYHIEERRSAKLPVVGGLLFTASYVIASAYASGAKNAEAGYIPFVGPFIAIATVEVPYKGDLAIAAFAITGIGELVGTALLVYGMLRTEPWLVQDRKGTAIHVMPVVSASGGGVGVGVVGAF